MKFLRNICLAIALMAVSSLPALAIEWTVGASGSEGWSSSLTSVTIIASTDKIDGWFYKEEIQSNIESATTAGTATVVTKDSSSVTAVGTPGSGNSVDFAISGLTTPTTNTYYYVIFKNSNGEYAVAGGTAYVPGTDNKATNNGNGYYDITVGASAPEVGDYIDMGWLGGDWKTSGATPEPTVFALLALGVAGLALRRRV